jgi:hypothetical protein
MNKFEDGAYIHTWNGFEPYYIGCFSSSVALGGEEKFDKCHGWFSGIGDVTWWVKAELDALSAEDQAELLAILTRNQNFNDNVKTHATVTYLAELMDVEGTHIIYRLGNLNIKRILDCEGNDARVAMYHQIVEEMKPKPEPKHVFPTYEHKDSDGNTYISEIPTMDAYILMLDNIGEHRNDNDIKR